MTKLTKVSIIDSHTLQLNTDAKKGDQIDLRLLDHVDTSLLVEKINKKQDEEYNRRLQTVIKEYELRKENDIHKAIQTSKEEITELKLKLRNQEEALMTKLKSEFNLEKEKLNNHIKELKREKDHLNENKQNEIDLAVSSKINDVKDQINEYKQAIDSLKQEKNHLLSQKDLEIKNAINDKEKVLNKKIHDLENTISKLSLEKSMMNIKKMGEELEIWVDQEYQNHALNGFNHCVWEKDNQAVKTYGESKATKADFIFKVYASEDKLDTDLLTSVTCEIKSEDPSSTYKKKNSDHYEKLHKDRLKKNCEYALLISELEWESVNDAPIRKISEYEKMYMVRPQYFIVFLSIVTSLANAHKNLLKQYNFERAKFKDSEDILNEFDSMKDEILNRSLKYIEDKMNDITTSVQEIQKQADKIIKASRVIMETHLRTVKNKIDQFNIKKISKQIKDLDI